MTDDAGFGIVESLDLEERVRALVLILRFRLTEHQAIAGGREKLSSGGVSWLRKRRKVKEQLTLLLRGS